MKNIGVLKALLAGIPINILGQTVKYFKKGDFIKYPSSEGYLEEPTLAFEMEMNGFEKVYIDAQEMSFCSVIRGIEKIPEEKALEIIANFSLNEMKKK